MPKIQIDPELERTNAGPWVVAASTTDVYTYNPAEGYALISWGYEFDDASGTMRFHWANIGASGDFTAKVENMDSSNQHYVRWYFVVMKVS